MTKSEAGKLGSIKTTEIIVKNYQKRIEEYNLNPKLCLWCSEFIDYKRKKANNFCSTSCAAIVNNRKRLKPHYFCLSCRNEMLGKGCNYKKYCNSLCMQDFLRKKSLENGTISSVSIKTFLIKAYGAKCMECGWNKISPYTNKVPIELEHIDGNSTNNSLENVKLLCPSCHSLTATYKALNKGNGRFKRMQRYRDGKSS